MLRVLFRAFDQAAQKRADYQRDDRGRPQRGAFIWRDLEALARACPPGG